MKRLILEKLNMIILVLALVLLAVGYIIMGTGDKTISVIIIVITMLVVIPAGILIGVNKSKVSDDKTDLKLKK